MAWSDYLMNIHEITLIPFINLVQVVYILFIVHIRWICYGLSLVTVLYKQHGLSEVYFIRFNFEKFLDHPSGYV